MAEDKNKRRQSETSVQSFDSFSDYVPTPPDGGWGWVIVLASFMLNVIVDGCAYTFGIFLPEFVEEFKATKGEVGTVGSMLAGFYLFSGVLVGGLVNKYGCRPVALAGSVVGCGAFLLSTFSGSVTMLVLTYGVLGGFGFGMLYIPAIVSVGYYFEKRRALATGIAVCGSGVGMFIFAPLSKYLLSVYDWRNALYIIAGIVLNGAVFAALNRPLKATKHKKKIPGNNPTTVQDFKGKRDRNISEMSETSSVRDTTLILEKVRQARMEREKNLHEDEQDCTSYPSEIFVRSPSIPEKDRIHKVSVSISDKTDLIENTERQPKLSLTLSESPSGKTESPSVPPTIVVSDEVSLTTDSSNQDFVTPPCSPPEVNSPDKVEEHVTENGLSSNKNEEVVVDKDNIPNKKLEENGEVHIVANTKPANASDRSLINGVRSTPESLPLLCQDEPKDILVKRQKSGSGSRSQLIFSRTALAMSRTQLVGSGVGSRSKLSSIRNLNASKDELARPMYRKDIFYGGSVVHIPQFQSQPDMKSYVTSITSIPFVEEDTSCWRYIPIPRAIRDILKEMLDVSLLRNCAFLLICLGNFLAFVGYFIPFIFLVDLAKGLKIDAGDAAFLLSIIGITNTIGRLLSGWLADFKQINTLLLNNFTLLLGGIAVLLVPVCETYPTLVAFAVVFGFAMSSFISLTSIILCDLMGLDKLTNAFGLLTFCRGLSSMAGPPLAGLVFDMTHTYTVSFVLGGSLIVAGAVCHFALFCPCVRKGNTQNVVSDAEVIEIREIKD